MLLIQRKEKHGYVGAAGNEDFGPTLCRTDVEDVGENQGVRHRDGDTGHYDIDTHHSENQQLFDGGACPGELEERRNVTHVVIDDVSITEGESQHAPSVGHGTHKPHGVDTHRQQEAGLMGHGDLVQQGLTDGHVSVIGH